MAITDSFLLTVHGVASENTGLNNIRVHCESKIPGLLAESTYYGKVIPYKNLDKQTAGLICNYVRRDIEYIFAKHVKGRRRLFVVAHSFGTLAVVAALGQIPDAEIEGLVLLGSIVPRDQYWDGYIASGVLKYPPFAVIRPLDRIVRLAGHVGGEDSGAQGFIANGVHRVIETHKSGGHTAYDPDDGEDVLTVINQGMNVVPTKTREQWLKQAGWVEWLRSKV